MLDSIVELSSLVQMRSSSFLVLSLIRKTHMRWLKMLGSQLGKVAKRAEEEGWCSSAVPGMIPVICPSPAPRSSCCQTEYVPEQSCLRKHTNWKQKSCLVKMSLCELEVRNMRKLILLQLGGPDTCLYLFMCFTCTSYYFSTEIRYQESTKTLMERKDHFKVSLRSTVDIFNLCLLLENESKCGALYHNTKS